MKPIYGSRKDFRELFTVEVNTKKMCFSSVGRNGADQFVLMKSWDYNIGNAYSSNEEFYLLSLKEVKEYAQQAYYRGQLSEKEYDKFQKL